VSKVEYWTQKILGYASLVVIPIVAVMAIAKVVSNVIGTSRGDSPKVIE
jgi:hypothetical protein